MLTRVMLLLLSFLLCFSSLVSPVICMAATHATSGKKIVKHPVKKAKRSSKKKTVAVTTPPLAADLNIKTGIDQIISKYPNLNIGVLVQSADTGALLYQYNAAQTFLPASTLKTLTATAALSYLGPNFVFPTQFFTDGKVTNGVLSGNLYVKFSGDPELQIADLDSMVNSLVQQGIRQINGNLIIDDTDMDRTNMAPGWLDREQLLNYAAPSNAIILNRNFFGITLVPVKTNGAVQMRVAPNIANVAISNQAPTTGTRCGLNIKPNGNNTGVNNYVIIGCVRSKSPLNVGLALNDTRATGTLVMKTLLQQRGINVTGRVVYTKTSPNLHLLVQHNSRPLSALITKMLKKSDNLIAGSLFKKLGGTYFNTTGTWQNGSQAVQAIIAPKTGIDFTKVMVRDGAGLSRLDWVSPIMFGKLFQYAYHMPFNNLFYQALPISGTDGTLKNRLGGNLRGRVHAKTGTMDGTSGLAGYVRTVNNQDLIFAILVNSQTNGKGNQGTYHYIEDRIVQFLGTHERF